MQHWAETHLEPRRNGFIVHRLDRAASGLILVAHSRRSARDLTRLFREQAVSKGYRVMVWGRFPEGEQHYDQPLDERQARSRACLLDYDSERDLSLLEVEIETGRKHQIRRQAGAGFPVVRDQLHGEDSAGDLAFTPADGVRREYRVPGELLLGGKRG